MNENFMRDFFGLPKAQKPSGGLSRRDYFAARALPAIIGTLNGPVVAEETPGDFERYAKAAYAIADAMLKASK